MHDEAGQSGDKRVLPRGVSGSRYTTSMFRPLECIGLQLSIAASCSVGEYDTQRESRKQDSYRVEEDSDNQTA